MMNSSMNDSSTGVVLLYEVVADFHPNPFQRGSFFPFIFAGSRVRQVLSPVCLAPQVCTVPTAMSAFLQFSVVM
jgi:hypothetical protein